MNIAQNVCLDDFEVKFETGFIGVKNWVTGPNQRKTLLISRGHIFGAIIIIHAQNVGLDIL